MNRQNMINNAHFLWASGGDEEYARGMCEIIAYTFPVADEDSDVTAESVREEIEQ